MPGLYLPGCISRERELDIPQASGPSFDQGKRKACFAMRLLIESRHGLKNKQKPGKRSWHTAGTRIEASVIFVHVVSMADVSTGRG